MTIARGARITLNDDWGHIAPLSPETERRASRTLATLWEAVSDDPQALRDALEACGLVPDQAKPRRAGR